MAEAIAVALITAVAGAAYATGTVLLVTTALVSIGISVGVSMLAQAFLAPSQRSVPPSDRQFIDQTPLASCIRSYGVVRNAGHQIFMHAVDGVLYRVVAHNYGRIDGIVALHIDDNLVTVDSEGNVVEERYRKQSGAPVVNIATRIGDDAPAHYARLGAAVPEWTTAHIGRGVASSCIEIQTISQKRFLEMFPNVERTRLRVTFRGALIWDPRDPAQDHDDEATWTWSDNAALVILDYLRHESGFALPFEWIEPELAAWIEAADIADEPVDEVGGGQVARYRLWGTYRFDERPADVLAQMLSACNGRVWIGVNGGVVLSLGVWRAPTVTIDDDAITALSASAGPEGVDVTNTLVALYTEPRMGYVEHSTAPWIDAEGVAAYGEKRAEAKLYWCPGHNQARRLLKQSAAALAPRWRGTLRTNLRGLAALSERFVRIRSLEEEIDITAEVRAVELIVSAGGIVEGCVIEFVAVDESSFTFDAATEEGDAAIPDELEQDVSTAPPADFAVVVSARSAGSSTWAVAVASWAETTRTVRVEYRVDGSETWLQAPLAAAGQYATETPPLIDGETYEFRAYSTGLYGASDFTSIVDLYVDSVAPGPATALSVDLVLDDATVFWTQPAGSHVAAARVYRGTSSDSAAATLIATVAGTAGATMSHDDGDLAAGAYWWWVDAVNVSGVGAGRVLAGTKTVQGIAAAILAIPTLTAIYAPAVAACRKVERSSPTTTALDGDPVGSLVSLVGTKNFTAAADAGRPVLDTDTSGHAWVHVDGADDGYAIAGTMSGVTHVVIAMRTSDADGVFVHHGGVGGTASPHIPVFQSGSAAAPTTAITSPSVKVNRGANLTTRALAHTAMSTGNPVVVTASGAAMGATANPAYGGYGVASGQFRFAHDLFGVAFLANPSAGELADVESALAALAGVTLP